VNDRGRGLPRIEERRNLLIMSDHVHGKRAVSSGVESRFLYRSGWVMTRRQNRRAPSSCIASTPEGVDLCRLRLITFLFCSSASLLGSFTLRNETELSY
jgi:hypothetical protein